MFRHLAKDIAFILIKNKIVDIEQRDVYVYGLEVFLSNASLLIIFLVISLLSSTFMHFVAFLAFFFPLRIFAGGYHAKTSEKCFALSTVMYAASLAVIRFMPLLYKSVYAMAAGIVFAVIIFIFAPLVNKNNELNGKQIKRNRIIARIILIADLVAFIACCVLDFEIASSEIVFVGIVCFLLLVGKFEARF